MPSTAARLAPFAAVAFVLWRTYARMRRTVGLQRLAPHRLVGRILVFSVLILLGAALAMPDLPLLASLGAGVVGGALLSIPGLRLTRFSDTPDGVCYRPNTVLGVALTLIFFLRLFYRAILFSSRPIAPGALALPAFSQSPLTLALFGLPAGYFVAYHAGLLRHPRNVG